MGKRSLIIVESPSKARTIERYLGKKYRVLASMGHVKDLPQKELGVNIDKNFKPTWVLLPGKYKIIRMLKLRAQEAPTVLIATDPDREGEAIAWHIGTELDGHSQKIKRVIFTEITPSGIKRGIEHLRDIDRNLVTAQQARRVIDRIVGFKVSEFLWTVLYGGLSAGRVQSVALRLVSERHDEIINFQPVEYWTLQVELKSQGGELFTAQLHKVSGKKPEIPNKDAVNGIMRRLAGAHFRVISIQHKDVKKRPHPPFITSTLQQEAAKRLGFSPARTMRIAQSLYEGVDIGEGEPTGLITYMRTDSTRVSSGTVKKTRNLISKSFGPDYLPAKPNVFKQKTKLVQGAHEAIRPSDPTLTPTQLKSKLKQSELRLYRLIWQRFVACQMNPAILAQITIDICAESVGKSPETYLFRTAGSSVKFDGFRRVYPPASKEKEGIIIPRDLKEGEQVEKVKFHPKQHFTKPPPYFSESTLIKELDSRGIGRPSTFADIVSKLYQREYVKKQKGKLIPTDIGITVNNILTRNLPDIFDVGFTARMEEELDEIETGKLNYLDVLNHFYEPFESTMETVRRNRTEIKSALTEATEEICDKCGNPMLLKWNRRGERFLACSGFPKCRNTKSLDGEEKDIDIVEKRCPDCGGELIIRTGRFGKYIGCRNYPNCKHTEPITTGIPCPEAGCTGEIVERRTKKKKIFYGCSRYPECNYISWRKPIPYHCQQCDNRFVEQYTTKKGRIYYVCPNCKSKYMNLDRKAIGELHPGGVTKV